MSAQYVTRREFEDWRDNLTGFFETALDRANRASERRVLADTKKIIKAEVDDAREEYRAEIKWLKEQYLAQRDDIAYLKERAVHTDTQFEFMFKLLQSVNETQQKQQAMLEEQQKTLQEHGKILEDLAQRVQSIQENQQKHNK